MGEGEEGAGGEFGDGLDEEGVLEARVGLAGQGAQGTSADDGLIGPIHRHGIGHIGGRGAKLPGPLEGAVTIATHGTEEVREFAVAFGLTQPGTSIVLKVYVVTQMGRERGSAAMRVERPAG